MVFDQFKSLIEALGKVVGALKVVANLPRAERDKYRQALDETFRIMDATLSMVILRLGDISQKTDDDFLKEARILDNSQQWFDTERTFRICHSLRVAALEAKKMPSAMLGAVSINDWAGLLAEMSSLLNAEGTVADYISQQFTSLAAAAKAAAIGGTSALRADAEAARQTLITLRQKLLLQEVALLSLV